ncbi:hypothetical protein [Arthrobacter sp.]|uniref:hypothetical protein n=1 Tax=Arthrobacter sp. TaxID=1667 RepID=UPI002811056E|nr:hypothetical protein [Arthrobacter sp.]
MKDISAADLERLLMADPALDITDSELARSRARSLSFRESDATHIFVGDPEDDSHTLRLKRRRVAGGFLAVAAVAAAVFTASYLQPPPVAAPAATMEAPPLNPAPSAAAPDPGQNPPAGPFHDLFAEADEVLVLEALPTSRNLGDRIGVEPVDVRQVLKGSRSLGTTSVDVAAVEDRTASGTLLWQHSQKEAPMTYLGFFALGADGEMHLMERAHALLQIRNIRTSATTDPFTDEPVDIGDDLRSRIDVAPKGDVPVASYTGSLSPETATDVIWGTAGEGGSREGLVRGHISAAEACFTFENSTEKVYLRWPAGFTAAVRPLPVDAEGRGSYRGANQADTSVILNEWGFISMTDGEPRPLVKGQLTVETASCAGETLPVFDVMPERVGGSPYQKGRGVVLPTP